MPWIPAEAHSGSAGSAAEEVCSRSFFLGGKGFSCRKPKAPCSLKHEHGGGFEYFLFSSLPGEMIEFDDHIF